jgi:hypothetical protein
MITSPSRNGLVTTFVHLHKADVPVKVVNVSTAPTARVIQEMKVLQTEEIFDGRYAVDVYRLRSIKPSPRVVVMKNTDRMKVLQTAAIAAVRAMRAVLCGILCGVSALNLRPIPRPND